MPYAGGGYSFARYADSRARQQESRDEAAAITPLAPGQDPLEALDPQMRALVTSTEPMTEATDADAEPTFVDRAKTSLGGAALGAAVGFLLLNGSRRSYYRAPRPIDGPMTVAAMAIGATIGGVSGFARTGRHWDVPTQVVPGSTPGAASADLMRLPTTVEPADPAFASLYR
jgi:hypothetical protein